MSSTSLLLFCRPVLWRLQSLPIKWAMVHSMGPTNKLYLQLNMRQQELQLQSCLCDSLDADSSYVPVVRCIRRVGACLRCSIMSPVAPRIVPVCPARLWGECDVQKLTVIGPNPEETGALLFPNVRHTHLHTHIQMHRRIHTWKRLRFSLLPLFKMPPE